METTDAEWPPALVASGSVDATYLVECYWPDVTDEKAEVVADRARHSAEELTREGTPVRYVGSILVPADEVVFYLFESPCGEAVREASERAEIPFERVTLSRVRRSTEV